MMTEEMFEKCLNKEIKIFEKMPSDVQQALREHNNYIQCISANMWVKCEDPSFFSDIEYRIDPAIKSRVVIKNKKSLTLNILEKCKNEELKIFANMDKDVQDMINKCEGKYGSQSLEAIDLGSGTWDNVSNLFIAGEPVNRYAGRIFRISEKYIEKIKKDIESKKYIQDIIIVSTCEGPLTIVGHLLVKIVIDKNGTYKVVVPRIDENGKRYQYDIIQNLEEAKKSKFFEEFIYDKISGNLVYVEFDMSKK